jgi:hypothetical protein
MKRIFTTGALTVALISGVLTSATPAGAALRVPKTTWPTCKSASDNFCVESVFVTTARGRNIPLTWVASGTATPGVENAAKYTPIYAIDQNNVVVQNDWWLDADQVAAITSPDAEFVDLADVAVWEIPAVGAKWDANLGQYDLYLSNEQLTQKINCPDPYSGESSVQPLENCYQSAIAVQVNNQVRTIIWFADYSGSFVIKSIADTGYFVDGAALASDKKQPRVGATYNAVTKTFNVLETLMIPSWIEDSVLINGATAAGSALATPETGVALATVVDYGRALTGRWTHANWSSLGLGALGYEGLFVDARTANEFVNHPLIDVLPTINKSDSKTFLATQSGNNKYATHLDSDVTINVTLRVTGLEPGVTIAVGTDVALELDNSQTRSRLSISGNPVTVPLASKTSDCAGEAGVAKANVRQFQTIIFVEGENSGFGVDGLSGEMYVGSNGVCSLSTPIWNESEKSFTWQVGAPHFAPDGQTQNIGFYKAIIPFEDAALLWGLANPSDAVTALDVSIQTDAGGSSAALFNISAKNNKIIIDVSGFGYSRPKIKVAIKKGWKPKTTMLNKTTITCTMGKSVKKITAVKPTCPKGYKKKN